MNNMNTPDCMDTTNPNHKNYWIKKQNKPILTNSPLQQIAQKYFDNECIHLLKNNEYINLYERLVSFETPINTLKDLFCYLYSIETGEIRWYKKWTQDMMKRYSLSYSKHTRLVAEHWRAISKNMWNIADIWVILKNKLQLTKEMVDDIYEHGYDTKNN